MTCSELRSRLAVDGESPEVLAHLRGCVDCLEAAVAVDPEFLFRSLGGPGEMPPGGLESFVDDVMRQVDVRRAERTVAGSKGRRPSRWLAAAAAALLAAIVALPFLPDDRPAPVAAPVAIAESPADRVAEPALDATTVIPVIEHYESANAMIVEVPVEQTDDLRIVMIFDQNLPVDL